ncbi:hypothetical protein Sjap_018237 [Stephania japonica]|uniref:R13L1/DRL21-like LRR repeat region domain-containing protein n=1 Tax=Stephania japonica TaxID=461633 RepID=A0AAP0I7M4_9MAGN
MERVWDASHVCKAKLMEKKKVYQLEMVWNEGAESVAKGTKTDYSEVVEAIELPPNLIELSINGFPDVKLPWTTLLANSSLGYLKKKKRKKKFSARTEPFGSVPAKKKGPNQSPNSQTPPNSRGSPSSSSACLSTARSSPPSSVCLSLLALSAKSSKPSPSSLCLLEARRVQLNLKSSSSSLCPLKALSSQLVVHPLCPPTKHSLAIISLTRGPLFCSHLSLGVTVLSCGVSTVLLLSKFKNELEMTCIVTLGSHVYRGRSMSWEERASSGQSEEGEGFEQSRLFELEQTDDRGELQAAERQAAQRLAQDKES